MSGVVDRPPAGRLLVILGCAVHAGGRPSAAMRRRVDGALATAAEPSASNGDERVPSPVVYVPVGGQGRHGPAEALVMESLLLEAGVDPGCIVVVPRGRNTIESLREAWPELSAARATGARVYVCTDGYHRLRCRVILRLWGLSTFEGTGSSGGDRFVARDAFRLVRDRLALGKDVPTAIWWRLRRRIARPG